jgi:hypothetical protein
MGTTDNFDTPTSTSVITATDTMPIIRSATGRGATATLDLVMALTGKTKYCCLEGNLGALASLGTSAAATANATYVSSVFIRHPMLVAGIGFLNGATAATDRLIYGLYAASGGAPLATSTLASQGTVAANANVFQEIVLTASYQITKPGLYFIGWQANGTTTTRRSIATATWVDVNTLSVGTAGSAGVMATITAPTTFTADTGPIGYVYGT